MKKLDISEVGIKVFNKRILNEKTHKLSANLSHDHVKAVKENGPFIVDIMHTNKPGVARFKAGDTIKFTWPDYEGAPSFTGKVTNKPVPDNTKVLATSKAFKPTLFSPFPTVNKEKWFYLDGPKVPELDKSGRYFYVKENKNRKAL